MDADPRIPADSFIVNGRQLLADMQTSFDDSFREWILQDSTEEALKRANPEAVILKPGDRRAMAQLENVRKLPHAEKAELVTPAPTTDL